MDSEVVTKRLHISGLTPALTVDDLSRRLGSYGSVKALDGFGKLDGLGQPRKYGYITLEAKASQIQKCMNVLSGSTWKGSKLRVGEAKPDFKERIRREHEPPVPDPERPVKRRRLLRGAHGTTALDMSLVTPENAADRSGWTVLPSGRLVRPIRTRPLHPLPKIAEAAKAPKPAKNGVVKKKKRPKPMATRARRRTIDMTRWGSTLVKGMYLENVVSDALSLQTQAMDLEDERDSVDDSSADEDQEADENGDLAEDDLLDNEDLFARANQERSPVPVSLVVPPPKTVSLPASTQTPTAASGDGTLREETRQTLSFIQSLFGDPTAAEQDWGGAESVDEDEAHSRSMPSIAMDTDEVVEVPASNFRIVADRGIAGDGDAELVDEEEPVEEEEDEDENESMEEDAEDESSEADASTSAPAQEIVPPTSTATKLKDLFAPREEEVGFSLLGHLDLDLDLELDDDLNFAAPVPANGPVDEAPVSLAEPLAPATTAGWSFNPTDTLFFPREPGARRGRAKDLREAGPDWIAAGFFRTETDAEIRARWDSTKLDLTREWKRRHREAVKSRRRRGGADD